MMTNEEAIDCLVGIKEYYTEDRDFSYYGDEYHGLTVEEKEALCMAISALNHSATDINVATKEPEIIHCRDCKYWEGEYINGFWYFEECSLNRCRAFSDDFCSWAEGRKE